LRSEKNRKGDWTRRDAKKKRKEKKDLGGRKNRNTTGGLNHSQNDLRNL